MPSPQKVAARAMAKQARNETLVARLVAAQTSYINDVREDLLNGLKREYDAVRVTSEPVEGGIPDTTYTLRKPRDPNDLTVTVRLVLIENNYVRGIVFTDGVRLNMNMPPDRTPDVVARTLLKLVGEVLG